MVLKQRRGGFENLCCTVKLRKKTVSIMMSVYDMSIAFISILCTVKFPDDNNYGKCKTIFWEIRRPFRKKAITRTLHIVISTTVAFGLTDDGSL